MDYVLELGVLDALKLIGKAREQQAEERAWQLYLMDRQNMTKDTFIPFTEYFKRMTRPSILQMPAVVKTKDDILRDVEAIRSMTKGKAV